MEPSFDNSGDPYEHLAFSHKAKSRLKNSIDLEKLMSCQPVTFEVDIDNLTAELCLEDDDLQGLDTDSYVASLFSQKTQTAKNTATIEELVKTDFMSVPFSDLEKSMTSIHANGLVHKEIVRPGTGQQVPENGKVFVHYVAMCEGADEPFDSTVLRNVPAIIDMRKADIIPGLYLAIKSMELKEVSKFTVKSSLAYGECGCLPRIPPGADIFYIIEVLQIIDEKLLQSPLYMTAEERALLPFSDILASAEQLRTDGNGQFKNESFNGAIKKYRKAAAMLEDYPLTGSNDEDNRNALLHTIYSNSAQCYLNLEKPAPACTMCKLGLKSAKGKESVKLLYRFAKAKLMLSNYEDAIRLCDQALKLEPTNIGVKDLRQKAVTEESKRSAASNKMFKNILNK